jgi:hypothetical protein
MPHRQRQQPQTYKPTTGTASASTALGSTDLLHGVQRSTRRNAWPPHPFPTLAV